MMIALMNLYIKETRCPSVYLWMILLNFAKWLSRYIYTWNFGVFSYCPRMVLDKKFQIHQAVLLELAKTDFVIMMTSNELVTDIKLLLCSSEATIFFSMLLWYYERLHKTSFTITTNLKTYLAVSYILKAKNNFLPPKRV